LLSELHENRSLVRTKHRWANIKTILTEIECGYVIRFALPYPPNKDLVGVLFTETSLTLIFQADAKALQVHYSLSVCCL